MIYSIDLRSNLNKVECKCNSLEAHPLKTYSSNLNKVECK